MRSAVLIIDDDKPGVLSWEQLDYHIDESGASVKLKIVRNNGDNGDNDDRVRI